ncbi:MAG: hypothetical protein Q4A36_03725 [Candidatus Saccharibacteria bacterium]|nr:hypothetical protein [Candidatus Saccharibacteria bacterium]
MGTDKKSKTSPKTNKRKIIIVCGIISVILAIIVTIAIVVVQKNSNQISGKWACAKYSQDTDTKDEISTYLVLDADGTYTFGDYNNLNDNHYAGKYSYSDDKDKTDSTSGISYYNVSFDTIDEFVIEGKPRTSSENMLKKAEIGIRQDKTQLVLVFISTNITYLCENK